MGISVKTKQWGNSIGIVIPNDIAKDLKLKPGEEIDIDIEKKVNVLKELFGTLKTGKTTKALIKEARDKFKSKWF